METMREMTTPAKADAPRPKKTGKGLLLLGIVAVLVLGGLLLAGLLPRKQRERELTSTSQAEEARIPEVNAVRVKAEGSVNELELPGSISAVTEASLYSRADGYLRKRLVDIGDRVQAGQLLAVVDSPELDQQSQQTKATLAQSKAALSQAQAALVQARSNQRLAEVTLQRWQTLVGRGVLSKQEGDEKQAAFDARSADVQAAQANVEAARSVVTANEANVQRVTELQSYEQVKAPWAGVITARNVDVGALISSTNSAVGRELFRIAQISTLRIYVNVPQTYVNDIHVGMPVSITVQQSPSEKVVGKVVRTSNNLDETTRTLLTEVQAPNMNGKLLPGMYATIKLLGSSPTKALLVPGDSLIISRQGSQVAVVENGVVRLRKIVIGRDYGAETEVISGLTGSEIVITNPSDVVREGAHVKPIIRAAAAPSGRPGVPSVAR